MATNLDLRPGLLEHALRVGGLPTKKSTVEAALEEFIARREQARILELAGTVDWDPEYDYKEDRRARDRKLGLID